MEQKTEPLKIVRLLQKELGWQLDYARSGVYSDGVYGLFFFVCPYHDYSVEKDEWSWTYTLCYNPKKEKQFSCRCGIEFKNVYEVWSKQKRTDWKMVVKEVNELIKSLDDSDNYEQLPQYRPSYGGTYRINKKLVKKNIYQSN